MVDSVPRERLQPALLDRLTDRSPQVTREPEGERVIDIERLRACVVRDLSWLLNSGCLAGLGDRDDLEEVRRSVLNYGIAHLEGMAVSALRTRDLEEMMETAIRTFEPRILPETVQVRAVMGPEAMNRNAVSFEIHGRLWAHPAPLHLLLRTELDLETGHVEVSEAQPGE